MVGYINGFSGTLSRLKYCPDLCGNIEGAGEGLLEMHISAADYNVTVVVKTTEMCYAYKGTRVRIHPIIYQATMQHTCGGIRSTQIRPTSCKRIACSDRTRSQTAAKLSLLVARAVGTPNG